MKVRSLRNLAKPRPNVAEIPNASVVGPKIMIYCVSIGCFTGLVFLIVLLFVAGDIYQVIDSTAGCLLQIFKNATANNAGAICLLMYDLSAGASKKMGC